MVHKESWSPFVWQAKAKKELGKLLRELCPLPQVPDRIEPIGPQLRRTLRNPTWEEYVSARAPRVRELPVGERPRDWANHVDPAAEALPAEPPYFVASLEKRKFGAAEPRARRQRSGERTGHAPPPGR
jgi:hypothetical protein